jgi:cytochrome b6-f complex iron-sulfur subunit
VGVLLTASVPCTIRFLRPQGLHGTGGPVELGTIQDYRSPAVTTRWVSRHGLWIVNRDARLFALEAVCTHLGCTPRWMPDRGLFRCPCHGSRFSPEGEALNGPAVEPLHRLAIRVEHDQVLVDSSLRAPLDRAVRDPRFFVRL